MRFTERRRRGRATPPRVTCCCGCSARHPRRTPRRWSGGCTRAWWTTRTTSSSSSSARTFARSHSPWTTTPRTGTRGTRCDRRFPRSWARDSRRRRSRRASTSTPCASRRRRRRKEEEEDGFRGARARVERLRRLIFRCRRFPPTALGVSRSEAARPPRVRTRTRRGSTPRISTRPSDYSARCWATATCTGDSAP